MRVGRLLGVGLVVLLLALVGVFVVGVNLLAYDQARSVVYPARTMPSRAPASVGLRAQTVRLASADGTPLVADYVAPPADGHGGVIVWVHGLSSNRAHFLDQAAATHADGWGALLLDLRNHGESGGSYTTMGVAEAEDVRAAIAWVLAQPGVAVGRLALVGESLGGATVLLAAADVPQVRAVVATSAYSSFSQVVTDRAADDYGLPPAAAHLMLRYANTMSGSDLYAANAVAALERVAPRPVLLVHGTNDDTTPFVSAERLAAAGPHVTLWRVDGAGHAFIGRVLGAAFDDRLRAFLAAAMGDV